VVLLANLIDTYHILDGHKKIIVEHNLNILLLPGLHGDHNDQTSFRSSASSLPGSSPVSHHYSAHPSLTMPGTSLSVPSPFHFQLHIITRLYFNEQGKVTHHRDFWDVKDVMGLVPGVSLMQWIGTRIAARGLAYATRLWFGDALPTDYRVQELLDA
jgi:hypothetical protein